MKITENVKLSVSVKALKGVLTYIILKTVDKEVYGIDIAFGKAGTNFLSLSVPEYSMEGKSHENLQTNIIRRFARRWVFDNRVGATKRRQENAAERKTAGDFYRTEERR